MSKLFYEIIKFCTKNGLYFPQTSLQSCYCNISFMYDISQVQEFLTSKSDLQKIIVVFWPTACGKTALWVDIALDISGEIISTDSRQIYRYLDIATGKVTSDEMKWVPHHMIDIIDPSEVYSVGDFQKTALWVIDDIFFRGKIPILVGGTWLYIDSLIYDFDIPQVPANKELRYKLETQAKDFWNDFLYSQLQAIDPEYALDLHPNNLQYIIRALEVKILSWKSKKNFQWQKILKYDTLFLTPYDWNRERLYDKINQRIIAMFQKGLIEETESILWKWYHPHCPWLKTIGYREVVEYLDGKYTQDICINKIAQANRNYAKRQITWFRNYK